MTESAQKAFVEAFMDSIKNELLFAINKGKVPEEWDGIELRYWLKERVRWACVGVVSNTMKGKRRLEFLNHCVVNNL